MTSRQAYFDDWYAHMQESSAKDDLLRRHFGSPDDAGPAGVLPWGALDEIAAALQAGPPIGVLVDVACGRGAYGIELAGRIGCELVGVDFSAVALDVARTTAVRRLPDGQARFELGELTATGLPDASADAVVCTDSVQFADPATPAVAEFRRVLSSGGRLVITSWRATAPGDLRVSTRLRHLDLERELTAAGFEDVTVEPRPAWDALEHAAWEDAVSQPGDGADPAMASLHDEARRSLDAWGSLQRVIATATAP